MGDDRCRGTDAPIRRGLTPAETPMTDPQLAPNHSSRHRPGYPVRAAQTGPPRANMASEDRLFKG